ncbi:hypothetical protein AAFF_G00252360 [Aldrovandia affinis]|uniref:Uncharacterized protein n=1 Tax=Aldrovandia affinis TaxID=143900 RepID=A0AAD7STT5_9TELE|nr:hypothetical protein AAFF_G00252360 [Aldrovandia affinis]
MTLTDGTLPLGAAAEPGVALPAETGLERRLSFGEESSQRTVHSPPTPGARGEERSHICAPGGPHSPGLGRVQSEWGRGQGEERGGGLREERVELLEEPLLSGQLDPAREIEEVVAGAPDGISAGTSLLQEQEVPPGGEDGGESGRANTEEEEEEEEEEEGCLEDMLKRGPDPTRVRCPLCRQRTPVLDWEIRRMQEEATLNMGGGGAVGLSPPAPRSPPRPAPPRRCAALARRESRAEAATVCGCFRPPRGPARALRRLRLRCRCCYLTCLLLLHLAELLCLLLVFLPVLVLVLLFTLAGK